MADTIKLLAQSYPLAGVLTDALVVPGGAADVVSTITVCNQGVNDAKIRLSVAIAGAADTPQQYVRYDLLVPAKDGFDITIGMTLAATDVVRVYSDLGTVSFNLFGVQT